MARDIKINYLQWSKGQVAKSVELFLISSGQIKPQYKEVKDEGESEESD